MKSIEIVTHAYAEEMLHFASALIYQISSLVLHEPKKCKVILTICYTPSDVRIRNIIKWCFQEPHVVGHRLPIPIGMFRNEIGRRCIGRNRAAMSTEADIVWFADVDQVFRDDIFDRLAEMEWPAGASMIYPRVVKIHKDHATGDELLREMKEPKLMDIDPEDFVDKKYRKAIGGVQIVQGDFAREHGYLHGDEKWQRPTNKPFGDFRDDVAYRRFCLRYGPIVGVDLPGMFRLRHTATTYQ